MKDVVHTISHYHDGPRAGVAHFDSRPHHYDCEFDDEAQEYGDVYLLTPIDGPTFSLVIEQWQIWLRWEVAFHAKETTVKTHPALPHERARYQELDQAIRGEIAANRPMAVRARGRFYPRENFVEWAKLPDGQGRTD